MIRYLDNLPSQHVRDENTQQSSVTMNVQHLYPTCRKVPVISWQPLTWSQTSFVHEHSNWHSFPYDGKGHGFVQLFPQKPFSHAITEITECVDP